MCIILQYKFVSVAFLKLKISQYRYVYQKVSEFINSLNLHIYLAIKYFAEMNAFIVFFIFGIMSK